MDFEIIFQLTAHLTSQFIIYQSGIQLNMCFSADPN